MEFFGALIALAAAAYAADEQKEATQEARAAEEEARDIQTSREEAKLMESRRQKLREERVRRARILQAAETRGTGTGSGVSGALSNVTARTGWSLAFQRGETEAARATTRSLQKASDFGAKASEWGSRSQFAQSAFSEAGGFKTLFDQ